MQIFLIVILLIIGIHARAQEIVSADTVVVIEDEEQLLKGKKIKPKREEFVFPIDTIAVREDGTKVIKSVGIGDIHHCPHTANMYAALVPGLGQIYNHKYWKLPIVYGGIGALVYAISFNNKYYQIYRRAYRDFIIRDPNNKAYAEVLKHSNLTVEDVETTYATWFQKTLSNKKNYYRRYRDMSIFGMAGVYIVQLIDAVVDAHFYAFDVSDDLSMKWTPVVEPETKYVGASFAINF